MKGLKSKLLAILLIIILLMIIIGLIILPTINILCGKSISLVFTDVVNMAIITSILCIFGFILGIEIEVKKN